MYMPPRVDVRDRLAGPSFGDEPITVSQLQYIEYQMYLDRAYSLKAREVLASQKRGIEEAYELLMQHRNLPTTLYQKIRTLFLFGEHFRELDKYSELSDRDWLRRDNLGKAIGHHEHAIEIATQLEDWALVAQLEHLVCGACIGSRPHRSRYSQGYSAANKALEAWHKLPDRDQTIDLEYEFVLADSLFEFALITGEDKDAFVALDLAEIILEKLRHRDTFAYADYANGMLFLKWNRASLHSSLGHAYLAYHHARFAYHWLTRHARSINRIRLSRTIALFSLDWAEEGIVSKDKYERLLHVAHTHITNAYEQLRSCDDEAGFALILLVHAKWNALTGLEGEEARRAQIDEAHRIAGKLNDYIIIAEVEMTRGDDHARQARYEEAVACYNTAEQNMSKIGCEDRARVARRKAARLAQYTESTP